MGGLLEWLDAKPNLRAEPDRPTEAAQERIAAILARPVESDPIQQAVVEALADGPRTEAELAEQTGYPLDLVIEALDSAEEEHLVRPVLRNGEDAWDRGQ